MWALRGVRALGGWICDEVLDSFWVYFGLIAIIPMASALGLMYSFTYYPTVFLLVVSVMGFVAVGGFLGVVLYGTPKYGSRS